ncbi:hypothetical protein CpipJ_CPIJ010623, partial [Culex quinquefasciatus]
LNLILYLFPYEKRVPTCATRLDHARGKSNSLRKPAFFRFQCSISNLVRAEKSKRMRSPWKGEKKRKRKRTRNKQGREKRQA